VDHLLPNEKACLDYIKGLSSKRKDSPTVDKLLTILQNDLKTINDLRGELKEAQKNYAIMKQLRDARDEAYRSSVQARLTLLEEVRFLRDKIKELKR
jgi:hypothetical protein